MSGLSGSKRGKRHQTIQKVRLSLPVVIIVWLSIQGLVWYSLERHNQLNNIHDGSITSSSLPRAELFSGWNAKDKLVKATTDIATGQGAISKNNHNTESRATTGDKDGKAVPIIPRKNIIMENATTATPPLFHLVFSTDCSGYQHWQGILLYYSARRVQQPGVITRIASGCTPEQQASIREEWQRIDPTGTKFRVHFAPSTALHNQKYKYSNKPGGILHWLQHQQPPLLDTNDDGTVVCLLDPDMVLLKPITADLVVITQWTTRVVGRKQVEYIDEHGVAQFLRVRALEEGTIFKSLPTRVMTGYPAGQHFGIGGAWVQGMTAHAKPAWQNFSKAIVCGGEDAPCTKTSASDAAHKYGVGPVYLATVADWKRIAVEWWNFVPKVHSQYPFLLAEMYSLTMAVANLELPFSLFSSYMVTGADVSSPTEAWSWIDSLILQQQERHHHQHTVAAICSGVDTATPPDWTGSISDHKMSALPNTLHYCQRYKLDLSDTDNTNSSGGADENSFLFAKRKIPHDVFSCQQKQDTASPVPFDAQRMVLEASKKTSWSMTERRSLFALCHVVPILNWARAIYQKEACGLR